MEVREGGRRSNVSLSLDLFQCHNDYCHAFDAHLSHPSPGSSATVVEAHNNYVQQLRAANGMIDQYYRETLPQLLQVSEHGSRLSFGSGRLMLYCTYCTTYFSQELDDVYHDVSAVVAETMVQGAEIMAIKVRTRSSM